MVSKPATQWILQWWRNPNWMKICKGKPLILHYSKDSCIAPIAFADADHAGSQDTRKSTSGSMQLLGVRTEYQLADIFTKPLARERLKFLINKLGMRSMSPETLKKLADEEEE
ncbi:hypothetical protein Tco_1390702 [Tanacetum coccineum]